MNEILYGRKIQMKELKEYYKKMSLLYDSDLLKNDQILF